MPDPLFSLLVTGIPFGFCIGQCAELKLATHKNVIGNCHEIDESDVVRQFVGAVGAVRRLVSLSIRLQQNQ